MKRDILAVWIGVALASPSVAEDLDSILELDLEDLSAFDVEMETAAKTTQSLNDIPASVYVLSNERIVRSGYTTIAELLSLVPGFLVTKYSETGFDISSKGFHDSFYNKLLIMVDGRSVYSPIYGSTYMADLDYLIADIEQIEIVRGPAGTMWGANAANGVVNIITKSAQNTQGTHVSTYVGQADNYSAEVRHGFAVGDYSFAKVFYKYKHSPTTLDDNARFRESHQYGGAYESYGDKHTLLLQLGGETSKEGIVNTWYTFDPDSFYYTPSEHESELNSHSWHLNLRHQYNASSATDINTTFFVNYDKDNDPFAAGRYLHAEVDSFANTELTQAISLTLGGGVRWVDIDFAKHISEFDYRHFLAGERAAAHSSDISDYSLNLYGQAEAWLSDSFKLVVGAKIEYFDQNKTSELSPQLRGLYNINNQHSLWAGIARAVMLPSYIDTQMDELNVYGGYPDLYLSDTELENESVVTFELGYRYSPSAQLEFDSVLFVSQYSNLRGVNYMDWTLPYYDESRLGESDVYDPWVSGAAISYLNDDYDAQTRGLELAVSFVPLEQWSLYASYAYLSVKSEWTGQALEGEWQTSIGSYGIDYYDINSQHTATIQSLWSPTEQLDIDVIGRYFNQQFPQTSADYQVDPFTVLDARVAWQQQPNLPSVELIAQNLLGAGHSYLNPELITSAYINERKWYARVTYDF